MIALTNQRIRSYSELSRLITFEERFKYLKLNGSVGSATFGFDRYLNQRFYTSREWKDLRYQIIARDQGCDLGVDGYEITDKIHIHHMNPVTKEDLLGDRSGILDPDQLICVSHATHNAIHYGDGSLIPDLFAERLPGDTKLW